MIVVTWHCRYLHLFCALNVHWMPSFLLFSCRSPFSLTKFLYSIATSCFYVDTTVETDNSNISVQFVVTSSWFSFSHSNTRAKALLHPCISTSTCLNKKQIRCFEPNNSLPPYTVCAESQHFLAGLSSFLLCFFSAVTFALTLFFFRSAGKAIQPCMTIKIKKTVEKPKIVHALNCD